MNLTALHWIDWALLAVLLMSVIVGLWRGLVVFSVTNSGSSFGIGCSEFIQ